LGRQSVLAIAKLLGVGCHPEVKLVYEWILLELNFFLRKVLEIGYHLGTCNGGNGFLEHIFLWMEVLEIGYHLRTCSDFNGFLENVFFFMEVLEIGYHLKTCSDINGFLEPVFSLMEVSRSGTILGLVVILMASWGLSSF